jgi:hypothetical protein
MGNARWQFMPAKLVSHSDENYLSGILQVDRNRPKSFRLGSMNSIEKTILDQRLTEFSKLVGRFPTALIEGFNDLAVDLKNMINALLKQTQHWIANRLGITECFAIIFGINPAVFDTLTFNGKRITEKSNTAKIASPLVRITRALTTNGLCFSNNFKISESDKDSLL